MKSDISVRSDSQWYNLLIITSFKLLIVVSEKKVACGFNITMTACPSAEAFPFDFILASFYPLASTLKWLHFFSFQLERRNATSTPRRKQETKANEYCQNCHPELQLCFARYQPSIDYGWRGHWEGEKKKLLVVPSQGINLSSQGQIRGRETQWLTI